MTPPRRPRRLGAVLSILVAAVAVALVATAPPQRTALAVATAGAVVLWGGIRRSRQSIDGLLLAVVGLGGVLGGVGLGAVGTGTPRGIVELVPGIVGIAVLAVGVAPLREGRERLAIGVGTGLVLVNVLASAAIRDAGTLAVLAAGASTVLAWDLAEQAVTLSEHVGELATTYRAEVVHGFGTAGVAVLGVGATWFVRGYDVTGLPLVAVLFLLAAAVTLTLVLYN